MTVLNHPLAGPASDSPLRVLLISRTYPPVIGGMERYAFHLASELSQIVSQTNLINTRGKRALPFFLPYAVAAGFAQLKQHRIDVIHLCDGVLAPVGATLKKLSGLPVTISIHGLDVTYRNGAYQAVVGRSLGQMDRLIAVSESTASIITERWPDLAERTIVVPNGVEAPPRETEPALPRSLDDSLRGKRVILTVGRLVRRKGVAWFVTNVLPRLSDDVRYVVAGDGVDRQAILDAVAAAGQAVRVFLLGRVTDAEIEALYRRADAFVMPNIVIPGDVEGFGLVALEAAVRGLPVLAADLQGIPDAIHDGRNGYLIESGNPDAWTARIDELLQLPAEPRELLAEQFKTYTLDNFSWRRVASAYADELVRVVRGCALAEAV
ncbi:MAG TPA: glycosyltransferase family 4 protein [Dehalococcoidia bacterium]|nr:glycosyltransferase family 4 protein [Dehalococcoidia bacterium]